MYLFTRSVMLAGPPAASTAHAIELCQYASKTMGRDIALWSAGFGAPLGAMVYAMRVEGLADLESAAAPLVADAEYHERLAAGQQFHGGPAQDSLAQPLFGELGDGSPPVGSVANVTTATMAGGHYGRAVALGHRHRSARVGRERRTDDVPRRQLRSVRQRDAGSPSHPTWPRPTQPVPP